MSGLGPKERAWLDGYEAGMRAAHELILDRVQRLPVLTVQYPSDVAKRWYLTDEVIRAIRGDE